MKNILIILILTLIFCGCNNLETNNLNLTPEEILEIINQGNYIILDVRTKEEYETSHIKDSLNIPYDEINENTILDKEKTILVYCQSGRRSKIAFDTLEKLGYIVYDLGAYSSINLAKE